MIYKIPCLKILYYKIHILMKVIAIGIGDDVFNHLTVDVSQIDNRDPEIKD